MRTCSGCGGPLTCECTPTPSTAEPSVEQRAVEYLARSFEESGLPDHAAAVRRGHVPGHGTPLWMDESLRAITKALQSTDAQDSYRLSADEHEALRDAHRASVKVVGRFVPAGLTDEVVEVLEDVERVFDILRNMEGGELSVSQAMVIVGTREKLRALLLKLKGQSQ